MRSFALGDMGPMIRAHPFVRPKSNAASNSCRATFSSSMHSNQPQYAAFSLCVSSQIRSWMPAIRPTTAPSRRARKNCPLRVLPERVLFLVELSEVVHEKLRNPVGVLRGTACRGTSRTPSSASSKRPVRWYLTWDPFQRVGMANRVRPGRRAVKTWVSGWVSGSHRRSPRRSPCPRTRTSGGDPPR